MHIITVLLVGFLALTTAASDKKIVCYFGSWSVYRLDKGRFDIKNIDPHLCTHLIYSFIGLNTDGTVKILDSWADLPSGKNGYALFNNHRLTNPKLKTMVAMGGWNEGGAKFSQVTANPSLRSKLVKSIVQFLETYKFDGFDLDWEYPVRRDGTPEDKQNYVLFLQELSKEFKPRGWLLSAAVAASPDAAKDSYDISKMAEYLDFINLMEYDFHVSSESKAAHNAPLYAGSWESGADKNNNVDASIKYWLKYAPAEKLIMGIPLYGQGFSLSNSNNNKIGAATAGPSKSGPYTSQAGMLGYNEICEKIVNNKWQVMHDKEQRVPYAVGDNQWVSYDDESSITEKGEYVKKNKLGGMMVWSLETDDFQGYCNGEKFPLLRAINRVLGNNVPSQSPAVAVPATDSQPIDRLKRAQYNNINSKTLAENNSQKSYNVISPPVNLQQSQPKLTSTDSFCQVPGYVRDPQRCDVFYHCEQSGNSLKTNQLKCPEPLVFDVNYNVCNYKASVNC